MASNSHGNYISILRYCLQWHNISMPEKADSLRLEQHFVSKTSFSDWPLLLELAPLLMARCLHDWRSIIVPSAESGRCSRCLYLVFVHLRAQSADIYGMLNKTMKDSPRWPRTCSVINLNLCKNRSKIILTPKATKLRLRYDRSRANFLLCCKSICSYITRHE
jgi:hypothetical protein